MSRFEGNISMDAAPCPWLWISFWGQIAWQIQSKQQWSYLSKGQPFQTFWISNAMIELVGISLNSLRPCNQGDLDSESFTFSCGFDWFQDWLGLKFCSCWFLCAWGSSLALFVASCIIHRLWNEQFLSLTCNEQLWDVVGWPESTSKHHQKTPTTTTLNIQNNTCTNKMHIMQPW